MMYTGRLEVYIVQAHESICEINLSSIQKGDADAVFDANDAFGQGDYLSDKVCDLLGGQTPSDHVIILRHTKEPVDNESSTPRSTRR